MLTLTIAADRAARVWGATSSDPHCSSVQGLWRPPS